MIAFKRSAHGRGWRIKKVIPIGDVHAPFICKPTFDRVLEVVKREKPDAVVQVGDGYDFFGQSRFPKKPGFMPPQDELEEGYEVMKSFWRLLQKASPKSTFYQLLGNHCWRPIKLSIETAPALYPLVQKSWKELFKFEGVNTIFDIRDDLEIDGVIYEHGFYGKPGQHMKENMKPTVIGHTHRPWVHYEQIRSQLLWELNVGYIADPTHEALSYPRKKWVKWVKGVGVIDGGFPRFIPL